MSSEWPVLPLEDCLDALIDYRGKTPEKTSVGIPLITAKIIQNGRIETPTEFIAEENYDAWMRRGIPKSGDVVLTVEAPLGEVAQLSYQRVALAQRVVTLRGKAGVLDSTYLLYLLQSELLQDQLRARATGTTVLGIKQSELRRVRVPLPPIGFQLRVASIMKAIDDRITLLHETNVTLEAIAQTLFKSWFFDFYPVHVKQQGLVPGGMDDSTAALFPDEFDESELGPIPRGWSIRKLADVLQPSNERVGQMEVPEYSSTNEGLIPRDKIYKKKLAMSSSKNKVVRKGDLVFGLSRRVLNFGQMQEEIGSVSSAYKVFNVNAQEVIPEHLGRLIRTRPDYFFNAVSASSREGQSVSAEALGVLSFVNPPIQIQRILWIVMEPLLKRREICIQDAEALRQMRDALLPRLISGKLPMQEAENMLAETAP